MKKTNSYYLIWGALFLFLGILMAGNVGGYWNIDIGFLLFYKGFWTLFLILPCIASLFQKGFQVSTVTAIVICCLITAAKLGYVDISMAKRLILPLLLMIVGMSFFVACFFPEQTADGQAPEEASESPDAHTIGKEEFTSFLSCKTINYDHHTFSGCRLSATFGELHLNLSEAVLEEPTTRISCNAICGSLAIHIPEDANVVVEHHFRFGGIHNYRQGKSPVPEAPTIYIQTTCILGGIDIR